MATKKHDWTVAIFDDFTTYELPNHWLLGGPRLGGINAENHSVIAVTLVEFIHTHGLCEVIAELINYVTWRIVGVSNLIDTKIYFI